MLCFGLDDAEKFHNLTNWQDEILKYAESNVDKKVVAMKCDLPGRKVLQLQSQKLHYILFNAKLFVSYRYR